MCEEFRVAFLEAATPFQQKDKRSIRVGLCTYGECTGLVSVHIHGYGPVPQPHHAELEFVALRGPGGAGNAADAGGGCGGAV